MVKRLVIAILLLALIGGGLVGFNIFRDTMIANIFANMPQQTATVSTIEAKPVTWTPTLEAIGTVNAAQGVDLTSESAGVVKSISFTANSQVAAGDELLRLDDVVESADVEAARTQAELAETSLKRTSELSQRGAATNASREQTEAAAEAAKAQLARAEAVLAQRVVSAPFAGTVGIARVDVGQYVTPGTVVATLQDLSTMRVDFSLPEQDLPQLAVGQTLTVRIEGLDAGFSGAVTGIDPRVDPATRLVALRGSVANADGKLTPGQFVRIRLDLPAEEGVIALPQTAVSASLYGDYVYIVRPKEGAEAPKEGEAPALEVRQVFVQTGRRSGGLVEVVKGVAAGDQVVTAGQNRLSNGQPAAIDNSVNPAAEATGTAVGDSE